MSGQVTNVTIKQETKSGLVTNVTIKQKTKSRLVTKVRIKQKTKSALVTNITIKQKTKKMTTAQVIETLVTFTNSSFQNYTHPDDHTTQTTDTPGFKPFTMLRSCGLTERTTC